MSDTATPAYFLMRIKSRVASGMMDFPISSNRFEGLFRLRGRGRFEPLAVCGRMSRRREGLCANR